MRTRLLAIPLLIIVAGLVGVVLFVSLNSLPEAPVDERDGDIEVDENILPPVEDPAVDIPPPIEDPAVD
ncbi:MAG: hypothetical protein V3R13_04350, partial [Nitrososphaerales archaeon]